MKTNREGSYPDDYVLTEGDARLAMFFEHYEAGGAFDYDTPEEVEAWWAQTTTARAYIHDHGCRFTNLSP